MKTNFLNMDDCEIVVLNLQLFATSNTQTTTAATEGNDLSAENKTTYDRVLLEAATPNLVYERFAQKKPIPAGGGKNIEFRRFSSLPKITVALQEGVTPNGQKLNVEAITATIAQYGGYVELSDLLELTAIDPVVTQSLKILGHQAGLTRDTIVRNAMALTTNVAFADKVTGGTATAITTSSGITADCKLTVKMIRRAARKMKVNNIAPAEGGCYVMIIHPDVEEDLKNDPEYADIIKHTNPKPLIDGELIHVDGVSVVVSTEALITKDGASSAAVYHCFVVGANAYGVTDIAGKGIESIIKQLGSSGSADPLNQRSTVGWKTNIAAEILSEEALLDFRVGSTHSATAVAN